MRIIKSFNLFGRKINENVYRPYVGSLGNLDAYKKISEWADINTEQKQDGKVTKITIYPHGEDETVVKYELREMAPTSNDKIRIGIYEFKDFDWEYIMGFSVSSVSDYESIFRGIEKFAVKELYDYNMSNRKYLDDPENLEPLIDCGNPDLIKSLITRIPESKVIKFFKDKPTSTYILNPCPDLKKKIMDKAGIKDFSHIGRALKRGFL